MVAYATRITEVNMQAIASEKPGFDLKQTRAWLAEHESGYFLRDPESPLDCEYFDETVFYEMYLIPDHSENALFIQVFPKV